MMLLFVVLVSGKAFPTDPVVSDKVVWSEWLSGTQAVILIPKDLEPERHTRSVDQLEDAAES